MTSGRRIRLRYSRPWPIVERAESVRWGLRYASRRPLAIVSASIERG
jgi:hypothetical protein